MARGRSFAWGVQVSVSDLSILVRLVSGSSVLSASSELLAFSALAPAHLSTQLLSIDQPTSMSASSI